MSRAIKLPLKYNLSLDRDALEKELEKLSSQRQVEELITQTKTSSNWSLALGVLLLILSVVAFAWIVSLYQNDRSCPDAMKRICNDLHTHDRSACYCLELTSSGFELYGFVFLAALVTIAGIVLLRSYVAGMDKVKSLENELLIIRDVRMAWQISKSLPERALKEPRKITREWNASLPSALTRIEITHSQWSYPQQRAQQQIIEKLLSR